MKTDCSKMSDADLQNIITLADDAEGLFRGVEALMVRAKNPALDARKRAAAVTDALNALAALKAAIVNEYQVEAEKAKAEIAARAARA